MGPEVVEDDDISEGAPNVFEEPSTTFTPSTPLDTVNPQVTRAEEQQPEQLPGTPPPEPDRKLLFVRDAQGQLKCAWCINGNVVEQPRDPTADEMKLAPQAQWRAVRQPAQTAQAPQAAGMVQMGRAAAPVQTFNGYPINTLQGVGAATMMAPPQGITAGKVLTWAALLAAVGYGGWKAWQWYEDKQAETDVDDASDVDEEVRI